jgi:cytochrome c oxidase subunit 3
MTAHATAEHAAIRGHATPGNRLTINRLGLWLFIVSDAFFFSALISSRYFVKGLHTPDEVNQALGLALTAVLLVSSLTAYRCEVAAGHGDLASYRRYTFLTILLGVLFLAGVGYEWHEAYAHFPPSTGYGTALFTLTGVHATHVLSGVVLLALVYRRGSRGEYGPGNYWPAEAAVKYWHFVDVAWVFIYPTLYLVR